VDDPAGASSQQREECRCGLLLTVEVPAKQVCSPVGDRCVQIIRLSAIRDGISGISGISIFLHTLEHILIFS